MTDVQDGLLLQPLDERLVFLIGDDSQGVHIVEQWTKRFGILSVPLLVHADAHPAADLLPPASGAVGVLEGAYLEHVGIVPSLGQGGVREDEADGIALAEQQLLVLQDQVIGADVLGTLLSPLDLAVDGTALLVDAEVT